MKPNNTIHKISNKDILDYVESQSNSTKKIIATTDPKLGLPRPSNKFLQKYCELGGIDEVLIEYKHWEHRTPSGTCYDESFELKIASDNTITIKTLEVKTSWTREEVIDLCDTLFVPSNWNISFDKWIEENLK